MGHCMNPECQIDLFERGTYVGQMAHIKPDAVGGSVHADNLLILCCNCHSRLDKLRTVSTELMFLSWKNGRNKEIRQRFSKLYGSFEDLEADVVPLLRRNRNIFDSYGPQNDCPDDSERHGMWLRFEGELIANNQKLVAILERNKSKFPSVNLKTVEEFIDHAHEFVRTRDESPTLRVNLFPPTLNSIFGIERVTENLASRVAALQNLIKHLADEDRFISLELLSDQVLTFTSGKRQLRLHLDDTPRVMQTYWAGKFYSPQTTKLRLDSLVFMLRWLADRNISYRFKAVDKLTELTLNDQINILFCYEYCVSRAFMFNAPTHNGLIVVNLHRWNGGPFSQEAVEYASEIGVRTMNQKQFFVFAHNNLV